MIYATMQQPFYHEKKLAFNYFGDGSKPVNAATATDEFCDSYEDNTYDIVTSSLSPKTIYSNYLLNYCSQKNRSDILCIIKSNSSQSKMAHDIILYQDQVIGQRFILKGLLGKGSFGHVVKACDIKDGKEYALKFLFSKSLFSSEISTLKLLNTLSEDNLFVKLFMEFVSNDCTCLVLELLGENLYEYLKNRTNFTGMLINEVQDIAYQLVYAINKLAMLGIIHCDIKPENIALVPGNNGRKNIKIIDFGSCCTDGKAMYRYIQSRFYRAVEVILELGYSKPIDMWSVGCVLVELMTGFPIFPGNSEHEQIVLFSQILGDIPEHLLFRSPKITCFYVLSESKVILKQPENANISLIACKTVRDIILNSSNVKQYHTNNNAANIEKQNMLNFIDLVQHMLIYDPNIRLKPHEALSHPYFTNITPNFNVGRNHASRTTDLPYAPIIHYSPIHVMNSNNYLSNQSKVYQQPVNSYMTAAVPNNLVYMPMPTFQLLLPNHPLPINSGSGITAPVYHQQGLSTGIPYSCCISCSSLNNYLPYYANVNIDKDINRSKNNNR